MSRPVSEARRIWTAPATIGVATLVCLVGALLAEGVWDGLASLVLFGVLAYATVLGLRPARSRGR